MESQLGNIRDLTDNFFYACDDMFLLRRLNLPDLATPLFGPVFRTYRSVLVEGSSTDYRERINDGDPEGEWGTLKVAGYLLGELSYQYIFHKCSRREKQIKDSVVDLDLISLISLKF